MTLRNSVLPHVEMSPLNQLRCLGPQVIVDIVVLGEQTWTQAESSGFTVYLQNVRQAFRPYRPESSKGALTPYVGHFSSEFLANPTCLRAFGKVCQSPLNAYNVRMFQMKWMGQNNEVAR